MTAIKYWYVLLNSTNNNICICIAVSGRLRQQFPCPAHPCTHTVSTYSMATHCPIFQQRTSHRVADEEAWMARQCGGRSMRYYYYYHLTLPQKWKTFGCPIKNSIIHLYFNSLRIIQTRSYEGYDNMARTRQKVQRQESEQWH